MKYDIFTIALKLVARKAGNDGVIDGPNDWFWSLFIADGFFLQFACKSFVKFKLSLGMAFGMTVLTAIMVLIDSVVGIFFLSLLVDNISGASENTSDMSIVIVIILVVLLDFLLASYMYGNLIKHPETDPIGFSKSCSIVLAQSLYVGGLWTCGCFLYFLVGR